MSVTWLLRIWQVIRNSGTLSWGDLLWESCVHYSRYYESLKTGLQSGSWNITESAEQLQSVFVYGTNFENYAQIKSLHYNKIIDIVLYLCVKIQRNMHLLKSFFGYSTTKTLEKIERVWRGDRNELGHEPFK